MPVSRGGNISLAPARLFRFILLATVLLLNACQSLPEKFSLTTAPVYNVPQNPFSLHNYQSMIGGLAEVEAQYWDSLALIGRYFGLGFDEISQANPHLDPWVLEPGRSVKLPLQFILPDAPRQGIVVNRAAKRLFYYPKAMSDQVFTYPIGIGRDGWETPLGQTRIVAKKAHPSWVVPASVRREHARKGDPLPKIVKAGPNNPLGDYALRLGFSNYLIHGTNKPYGVGMEISHGCIRLYPEDIARLFRQIPNGTPVRLVDQPYLTAWEDDRLFLQAYTPAYKAQKAAKALKARLRVIERDSQHTIDWKKVEAALLSADGIPTSILMRDAVAPVWRQATRPPVLFDDVLPKPLSIKAWRLSVASFDNLLEAQRLAAILNHQGPPIPAHVLRSNGAYSVVAGPFKKASEATAVAKRIRLDFSLNAYLINPGKLHTRVCSRNVKRHEC